MLSGQKSLKETEATSDELSGLSRNLLGIERRLSDTTARDILVRLDPDELRNSLHLSIKTANRRKALNPDGLPCGVIAMDGKWTSTPIANKELTQNHTKDGSDDKPQNRLRTITSCLTSSRAKPCIDAFLVPPSTNEKGVFKKAFDELLNTYGDSFFEVITYDAGACTLANATYVNDKNKGYVFALKNDQKTLFEEAEYQLGSLSWEQAIAYSETVAGKKVVKRRLWLTTDIEEKNGWDHLRVMLRVESVVFNNKKGGIESVENRYFVSNVPKNYFKPQQWLEVIRRHWNVENNCHNTWDKIFREDDRPWILEPKGMLIIQLLRRITYNLLALFRSVTQRSKEKRQMPFKDLLRQIYLMFITFSELDLQKGSKLEKELAMS